MPAPFYAADVTCPHPHTRQAIITAHLVLTGESAAMDDVEKARLVLATHSFTSGIDAKFTKTGTVGLP